MAPLEIREAKVREQIQQAVQRLHSEHTERAEAVVFDKGPVIGPAPLLKESNASPGTALDDGDALERAPWRGNLINLQR